VTEVDHTKWTPRHMALIRRAALDPEVVRIFVHPAIKKAICKDAGTDRAWISKVRPWHGHFYHFHVRLRCPEGDPVCVNQPDVFAADDGCGPELASWLRLVARVASYPPPKPDAPKPAPRRELTLAELPPECSAVLASVGANPVASVPMPTRPGQAIAATQPAAVVPNPGETPPAVTTAPAAAPADAPAAAAAPPPAAAVPAQAQVDPAATMPTGSAPTPVPPPDAGTVGDDTAEIAPGAQPAGD
jgi:penicillin-insensitive murein endopeptidase